jgi:hypothetical protein
MSNKVKTPWYKRIYGFLEKHLGGTLTRFLLSIFGVYFLVFVIVLVIGVATKVEVGGDVDSTTTYSESSTVVPVYTRYNEGSENFNKVIADLEFYNTKPEKTEVTRFVKSNFSGSRGYDVTESLIDNKDAESLYYHTSDYVLLPFEKTFQYLIGITDEDKEGNKGTLIFYNKAERTYTSKSIKGMTLSRKSSKGEADSYYTRKYEGYQGAPKPVYSYSPTVELVAYKDGTYEWKSNDNWQLDNEAELQSYISSSPKKKD